MSAVVHPLDTAETQTGDALVGRRGLLAGLAAIPVLILAADAGISWAPNTPARRQKIDPEPLRRFPGLAEGFYRAGRHVYYLDEYSATWAPPGLVATDLSSIEESMTPQGVSELLADLRRRRWAWAVEHSALRRLESNRPLAVTLLTEALSDPKTLAASGLRLADLFALILLNTAPYRLEPLLTLASPAALHSRPIADRLAKWRSPTWTAAQRENPDWRSPGTDSAPFTARIARR